MFGAIGVNPIGIGARSTFPFTLPAVTGAFTLTGGAAAFSTTVPITGTSYSETGSAVVFKPSLGAITGSFVETGSAITITVLFSAPVGASYLLTGFPASLAVNSLSALTGNFLVTGFADHAGITMPTIATNYTLTGNQVTFTRDFVNWVNENTPSEVWTIEAAPSRQAVTMQIHP
jgi:hypothetical protein